MDSVPLVIVTGNVPQVMIGSDSFQEIDICGISMPITKHNYLVKDINKLSDIVREAFTIASSGRKGPVLIDIPKDITAEKTEYIPAGRYVQRKAPSANTQQIHEAAQMIMASSKPLIFAGGGVISSNAAEDLIKLADKIHAPVSLSIMGLTALPWSYPRNLGMVGMHGTPVSNHAMLECDLLIAIGTRFSDRVCGNKNKFAPHAKIIHIDVDASEQGKNIRVDLPIQADAKDAITMLISALPQLKNNIWIHSLLQYKAQNPVPCSKESGEVDVRDVLSEITQAADDDTIVVTDVGQHQMLTAQYYKFSKPRSFVSSCGHGTMGYGMGAAIGAQIANPDRRVVLITGDGSFHMNMNEMACAVSENLPITVFIMNNGTLGMVRQWQKLFYNERYSATEISRKTNFVDLAHAFGAKGFSVSERSQIRPVIEKAFSLQSPCIVDCVINKDNDVFPFIPPNGAVEDMIFCE